MQDIPIVRQFMTRKIMTLGQDWSMEQAMKALLKYGHSGAPVVDDQGRLRGILSEKDCLRMFFGGMYDRLPLGLVEQFMSTELVTCGPDDTLFQVVEVFFSHSFRRLPVVDEDRLVGIISRKDVLLGSKRMWEKAGSENLHDWTTSGYFSAEILAAIGKGSRASSEEVRTDQYA